MQRSAQCTRGEDVFPERDFTNVKVETDVEKRLLADPLPQSILDESGNRLSADDVRAEPLMRRITTLLCIREAFFLMYKTAAGRRI